MNKIRVGIQALDNSKIIKTEVEGIDEHFYMWDEGTNDEFSADWELYITYKYMMGHDDITERTKWYIDYCLKCCTRFNGPCSIIELGLCLQTNPIISTVKFGKSEEKLIKEVILNNENFDKLNKNEQFLINYFKPYSNRLMAMIA